MFAPVSVLSVAAGLPEVKTTTPLLLHSCVLTRKTESTELFTGVMEQLCKDFEKGQSMVGKGSTMEQEAKGSTVDREVDRAVWPPRTPPSNFL